MSIAAEVSLWGTTIGAIYLPEGERIAQFEYDPAFIGSGIQPSPLAMPLSRKIYRFPELSLESFHGLPGLVSDSLPDKFGNTIINTWLAKQGRTPESFTAIERLCYTGTRGMGALEYRPTTGPTSQKNASVDIEQMVDLASQILSKRNGLSGNFIEAPDSAINQIIQIGTSAGGARAKAVTAWNESTGEIKSGQHPAKDGFEYWLMKFDGIKMNADKEKADTAGYTAIEYAYYLLALDAGIEMNECRLFEEKSRKHFMTKRFDRNPDGSKMHMQTLAALSHFDFNSAGAYSYEQVFDILRRINAPTANAEQFFRRMAFNIIFRNQDDHVKNIAFLMDRSGNWRLSPAYDITYSYNPSGFWTGSHQMTLNGKRDNFEMNDFLAAEKSARLIRGRGKSIVEELSSLSDKWMEKAEIAGVGEQTAIAIQSVFRKIV